MSLSTGGALLDSPASLKFGLLSPQSSPHTPSRFATPRPKSEGESAIKLGEISPTPFTIGSISTPEPKEEEDDDDDAQNIDDEALPAHRFFTKEFQGAIRTGV